MASNLPILSSDNGLRHYLEEIRKYPMLTPEEEFMLAKRLQASGDTEAAHRLVTSHLRLVASIAMGYRGYGLPLAELIGEGNIGMMQAVKKFDPDKGFRLATYAMWWIKASIQEYVLRSWSLVKIGTSAAQKRLFFNLRKLKSRIGAYQEGDLTPAQVAEIAAELDVTAEDVIDMNRLMAGPARSLNARMGDEEDGAEMMDFLVSPEDSQETRLIEDQSARIRHQQLSTALATLNEREREIFMQRQLEEEPKTLEELSQIYSISRERVRQIEARAFEKIKSAMTGEAA